MGSEQAEDPHCPQCGYNLRGIPEDRCPECGFGFDLAGIASLSTVEGLRSLSIARCVITFSTFSLVGTVAYLSRVYMGQTITRFTLILAISALAMAVKRRYARETIVPSTPLLYTSGIYVLLVGLLWTVPQFCAAAGIILGIAWYACLQQVDRSAFSILNLPVQVRRRLRLISITASTSLVISTLALLSLFLVH